MLAKEKFAVTFNGQSCRRNFQRAKRAYFERELDTDMEMDMDMAEDVAPSPLFLFAISACVCDRLTQKLARSGARPGAN